MENAKKVLYPIAEEYRAKWKAADTDPKVLFFYAGDGDDEDDIVDSLRQFAHLPAAPLLAIIDIPSQQVFTNEEKNINEKVVRDMVEAFLNKKLTGKPLRP